MKVLAYCFKPGVALGEEWRPSVPVGIVTTEGFLWKDERLVDDEFKTRDLPDPLELPTDHWIGIETDGTSVILSKDEETQWRITKATQAIQTAQLPSSGDPEKVLQSVSLLHAATALMGVRVINLQAALHRAQKSSNEPLETTVRALVEEMAKQK